MRQKTYQRRPAGILRVQGDGAMLKRKRMYCGDSGVD